MYIGDIPTYYTDTERGLIPEYDNLFNLMNWELLFAYDPISRAPQMEKPTLIVVSDKSAGDHKDIIVVTTFYHYTKRYAVCTIAYLSFVFSITNLQ